MLEHKKSEENLQPFYVFFELSKYHVNKELLTNIVQTIAQEKKEYQTYEFYCLYDKEPKYESSDLQALKQIDQTIEQTLNSALKFPVNSYTVAGEKSVGHKQGLEF